MTVGKTPLKSGRRKQPRIIAQFPVEFRFKADGGNFQIVQGITSNLSEEGVSCRLREPIPATASYANLSVVTDQKQYAVSGRIMWINSLDNECGVKVENATTDWKQFILATVNDTSLSSDRRTLDRRQTNQSCDFERRVRVRRFLDLYLNAPDPKRNELKSIHLSDTYNGSKLAVKFLTASGWGPLLNLGYFELKQLPFLIGGLNRFQRYLAEKSVELLNPQPNESILDLACGKGWTTQFIAQHGSKTTGLDLCEPHIQSAQSTFGKAANISFIQADATHLENVATPNSIDKIHCLEAAFHFGPEGRKALLNSAFHVLKPGGTFVLVDITWRTNCPEQIDDLDPENGFRETWQMELFEPFERYTKNAKAIGFVERQILDWTKPVMRILDFAALTIFMGQHSLTRKVLEIARSEYSAITEHEWKLLLHELRLSQRVLGQSRYTAFIFTKP